jgi:hypothetical protein
MLSCRSWISHSIAKVTVQYTMDLCARRCDETGSPTTRLAAAPELAPPVELLRVEVRADSTVQNISDSPIPPTPAWLPASVADSPGSKFLEYRVRITPPGGPVGGMVTRALGAEELRRVPSTVRAGWITLDLDQTLDHLRVPPGATQDFTLVGVTYQPAAALLPLVLSNPAPRQTVRIGGPALGDLDLDVLSARTNSHARR